MFKQLVGHRVALAFVVLLGIVQSSSALAGEETSLDTGDTAWILVSTALVLFMKIPALALFYGGLVRSGSVGRSIHPRNAGLNARFRHTVQAGALNCK